MNKSQPSFLPQMAPPSAQAPLCPTVSPPPSQELLKFALRGHPAQLRLLESEEVPAIFDREIFAPNTLKESDVLRLLRGAVHSDLGAPFVPSSLRAEGGSSPLRSQLSSSADLWAKGISTLPTPGDHPGALLSLTQLSQQGKIQNGHPRLSCNIGGGWGSSWEAPSAPLRQPLV